MTKCPICSESMKPIQNLVLSIIWCPKCYLFGNLQLLRDEESYETRYDVERRGEGGRKLPNWTMKFTYASKVLEEIGHYAEGDRLLEMGFGKGELLFLAKKRGYAVQGIEISKEKVQYAKKAFNLSGEEVMQGNVLTFPFKDDYYDVVIMQAFFEHVKEINRLLSIARSALQRGGILYINVPRYHTPLRRLLKRRWYPYGPRGHYWYFSKFALKKILTKHNFDILQITTPTAAYVSHRLTRKVSDVFKVLWEIGNTLGEVTGWGDKLHLIAECG